MKKYKVTVNGSTYEVEVEEVGGSMQSVTPEQQTKPKPEKQEKETESNPQVEKQKEESESKPQDEEREKETISAPMPGSILEVKVAEGDEVVEGDVLLILEAMKMENEIVAPRAGKVVEIKTSKGASVNSGDPLISLK